MDNARDSLSKSELLTSACDVWRTKPDRCDSGESTQSTICKFWLLVTDERRVWMATRELFGRDDKLWVHLHGIEVKKRILLIIYINDNSLAESR